MTKITKSKRKKPSLNTLISSVSQTHSVLSRQAITTVDRYLTIRNWLIGFYITQYEQSGNDRAKYGENLLEQVSIRLRKLNIPSTSKTNLKLYRQFYNIYPQIGQTVSDQFAKLPKNHSILVKLSPKSQTASDQSRKIAKTENPELQMPADKLINHLSFSHFVELVKIADVHKRLFYEMETIRSTWGIRELKRQINSLYYERIGLSKNKAKLISLVKKETLPRTIEDEINDPYIFEFLGGKMRNIYRENNLRDALINKLQDFILELGKGFCFEDRNKKILIGDNYYRIDLVFYHRILKANILLELKIGKLEHKHIGQLNSYLNYYKKHEMIAGDNPPIGLLLCAEKDHALVEYSLAGLDNKMFVSKYKIKLPSEKELQTFVEDELKEFYNA